jgi:hypothetical protein
MMRTIEVFLVIIIITSAFIISAFFAILPQPRRVSPLNLRRIALSTLQTLDMDYALSETVFKDKSDPAWAQLQIALSACLPPNIVYNFTVYEVQSRNNTELYRYINSFSNAESLGIQSDASSYLVASSNVTFHVTPEKIGEHGGGGTLYILNCSDANGWWITGYTAQSLATDLYNLLSPYFQRTIMVQTTAQLGQMLAGTSLQGENIQNAVVINTCGEAVPIPTAYCTIPYSNDAYAYYAYFLGQKVNQYNWTWASIVGYPFYYVSNTGYFNGPNDQNGWGLFGMKCVAAAGLNSFLRGLNGEGYVTDTVGWITLGGGGNPASAQVQLSSSALGFTNYYGIYPSPYQTATRAVPSTIQSRYNLNAAAYIFDPVNAGGKTWLAGATFVHTNSTGYIKGKLIPIGLTRTADIRITALAILSYYEPRLYRSEYTAAGTSRLVVLQLGQVGGI